MQNCTWELFINDVEPKSSSRRTTFPPKFFTYHFVDNLQECADGDFINANESKIAKISKIQKAYSSDFRCRSDKLRNVYHTSKFTGKFSANSKSQTGCTSYT